MGVLKQNLRSPYLAFPVKGEGIKSTLVHLGLHQQFSKEHTKDTKGFQKL